MFLVKFLAITVLIVVAVESVNTKIKDPATVTCSDTEQYGPNEHSWCEFSNGLIRGGQSPRRCAGQCICEGHTSFHGDNLDWIDGKCVTPKGHACGNSTDGTMEIFCETGTQCIVGRCRDPNVPKLQVRKRCLDDVECQAGLKCRSHFVQSPPLPGRTKRAIGPQWCCSARVEENDNTSYTMTTLPCDRD